MTIEELKAWQESRTDTELLTILQTEVATGGPLLLHCGFPKGDKSRGLALCGSLREAIRSISFPRGELL